MPKIVFAADPGENRLAALAAEFPSVSFVVARDVEDQMRELPSADAVVSWPRREALPVAKQLRWVHCTSAGIERISAVPELIDLDEVTLTNARGAHGPCIADSCFAFILALTRNIPILVEHRKEKLWSRDAARGARELSGSVLGILGLGKIGSEIARRGVGFGMEIRAIDINPRAEGPGVAEVWPPDRLDDLLRVSDFLAVALPITAATRDLIGARELGLMKPDASVYVMSRGGIVDQDALAKAIAAGRLYGAGLDATKPEPLPAEHPLWDLPTVLISPHCSASSRQTRERTEQILRENIRRFLAGESLLNVCDKRAGY
jgi:phosphoglycerate dehydrogenase-like enzyme